MSAYPTERQTWDFPATSQILNSREEEKHSDEAARVSWLRRIVAALLLTLASKLLSH